MRIRFSLLLMVFSLAAWPAAAQETRGNISGTVQDSTGVVPGAAVTITNIDTKQTQQLTTNSSGYFEAPLLNPGNYEVSVAMPGFKTLSQANIVLSVGQALSLNLKLEVGQVSERIEVTAVAPILDTNTVSSGMNFDEKTLENLPMISNMPIMVARFSSGVNPLTTLQYVAQGFIDGTTNAAGGTVGGVGFNNFTIDGATNSGSDRRLASSPNSDMIQEMRVESSNFDASIGHGMGNTISMMTRAGTNSLRGSGNYQYWTNRINSLNAQQKTTFATNDFAEREFRKGRSHNAAFTLGGPLVIPKLVNGRNKLFFFANYSKVDDSAPGRNAGTSTIPYGKQLDGDFSDLLQLPSPGQYQIYDPLTVRPDPARPGKFIRDPFPGNIIPKDRFMNADGSYKNPLFAIYKAMLPQPNQNFISPSQQPTNNYYQGGQPDTPKSSLYAVRVDYNMSNNTRFFVRGNGNRFAEGTFDWTYEAPDAYKRLHDGFRKRYSWSFTGNGTRVIGQTVIDSQISSNQFYQRDLYTDQGAYKPSDFTLPSYMDDFCTARGGCRLPVVNIGGYQAMSNGVNAGVTTTNLQGQVNLTTVKASHTLRGGVDIRRAWRAAEPGGNTSGSFTFNNSYTRAADTTTDFPAANLGLSMAALMLGMPSTVSITQQSPVRVNNDFYSGFGQDTWRLNRNFTINVGLRFEYENGILESGNRMLVGFDPAAQNAITQLAQAAYAANPIPEVPAAQFQVLGGPIFASDAGQSGRSWKAQAMWMPRVSGAYKLGPKMVLKGGWGLFYDTLNAADFSPNQQGYDVTTTSTVSTDFGQTWLLGDPKNGVSPLVNPFPTRADGTRFDTPIGATLGINTLLGQTYTSNNLNHEHGRVQRWRFGLQRELTRNMAVEIAYDGSYADRLAMNIPQSYVPASYYNSSNVRDNAQQTFLQANVTNPFNINNFAALKTTNPTLYQRMAGNAFFTSTTLQRQNLLRAFPEFSDSTSGGNGVIYGDQPLGKVKTHALDISLNRRFSQGFSANVAFSANRATANRTVETYDRVPTLWQTSNNARPFRITSGWVYELPFGASKPLFSHGGIVSTILGGWQTSGTFEYQPGALLDWGNIFFTGNLKDIAISSPQIALQADGTVDATKKWFNTDAGFEKDPALQPASFQKRVFPFRIDGVRGFNFTQLNVNFARNFDIGGHRSLQFRVDLQNALNRQQWGDPNLTPTSTNFGLVTAINATTMRQIVTRVSLEDRSVSTACEAGPGPSSDASSPGLGHLLEIRASTPSVDGLGGIKVDRHLAQPEAVSTAARIETVFRARIALIAVIVPMGAHLNPRVVSAPGLSKADEPNGLPPHHR